MRLLCIVKRVPDSRATISVRPGGAGIETGGLRFVCDPFDEFGVAQAVLIKSQRQDVSEIVVMGAGGAEVDEPLRHAMAMGATRAVRIDGDAPMHDELRLASVVAAAVKKLGGDAFDLIFCGKQNIDNDAGEFGPALAEAMDLPHVGAATKFELSDDGKFAKVNRRIEGAEEVLEVTLPGLITCEKGLIEPKQPALPAMMKAKKLPVETIDASSLDAAQLRPASSVDPKLAPPAARPACKFIEGDAAKAAAELVRLLREEAKVI